MPSFVPRDDGSCMDGKVFSFADKEIKRVKGTSQTQMTKYEVTCGGWVRKKTAAKTAAWAGDVRTRARVCCTDLIERIPLRRKMAKDNIVVQCKKNFVEAGQWRRVSESVAHICLWYPGQRSTQCSLGAALWSYQYR